MRQPMTPDATGTVDIYEGRDPVGIAAYSIPEASDILKIPASTIRYWVSGAPRRTRAGRRYEPVIRAADVEANRLSFQNLVELHVLRAIRRQHQVDLPSVRRAIAYLRRRFGAAHPLLAHCLFAEPGGIVVEAEEGLVDASAEGQLVIPEVVDKLLARVDAPGGAPTRLYPYVTTKLEDGLRPVWVDPRIEFGRPCLVGTGIRTDAIADQFLAGDTPDDLAADYERSTAEILGVIRYELGRRHAA